MNLYVSNLAYSVTDAELRSEFAAFGEVLNARVVLDRETNRSRGFGFVEMPNDAEAQQAIRALEGSNLAGRPMRVVEARPREERPPQQRFTPNRPAGGGGGNSGGGGGGYKGGGHGHGNDFRGGGGGGGGGDRDRRDRDKRGGKRDRGERGERGGKWERGNSFFEEDF